MGKAYPEEPASCAHAEKALAQAPDDNNRQSLAAAIERPKVGQDVDLGALRSGQARPFSTSPAARSRPKAQAPRADPLLPPATVSVD